MRLYELMNTLRWPVSYGGKIFALCFVGTHVPLLALVLWAITASGITIPQSVFIVVLLATLLGTGFTLIALSKMLAPVHHSAHALRAYATEKRLPALPTTYVDEAGQLMASVQATIEALDGRMSELAHVSRSDELTGAMNRRWMNEVGIPHVEHAIRHRRAYALMVIDLDEFKQLNDRLGHSMGDQVLLVVADAIRSATRPNDTVVRTGGDEFCVFLPGVARQQAHEIAERCCAAVAEHGHALQIELRLSISVGVAVVMHSDNSFKDVYRRADRFLYNVKEGGRGHAISSDKAERRLLAKITRSG